MAASERAQFDIRGVRAEKFKGIPIKSLDISLFVSHGTCTTSRGKNVQEMENQLRAAIKSRKFN